MPDIMAFRGTYYNTERAGDPALLVSPCISEVNSLDRALLAARSKSNVIRALKPLKRQDGTYDFNGSGQFFRKLRSEGMLVTDSRPSIYKYTLTYCDTGESLRRRTGIYCLIESSEGSRSSVLPHERTFPDAVRGWATLSASAEADLSAVFGLFEDEGCEVMDALSSATGQGVLYFKDASGQSHELARLDPATSSDIISLMRLRTVVIADGHHRYEAARQSQDARRRHTLACLFALDSDGIQIKPFHRHVKGVNPELLLSFQSRLAPRYNVRKASDLASLMAALRQESEGTPCFGAYTPSFGYLIICPFGKTCSCSAELLHEEILPDVLDFGRTPYLKDDGQGKIVRARVNYTASPEACVQAVDDGYSQAAFFTVAPSASQVMRAARYGKPLPEKSTCFQPKPVEGLLFRSFEDQ